MLTGIYMSLFTIRYCIFQTLEKRIETVFGDSIEVEILQYKAA